MTGLRNVVIAGCALSLLAGVAVGQFAQPDETLPGFKANDVLFSGVVDNVSAYSGDTGIIVPLGRSFHLGPGTDWQLKAYNTLKDWYINDNYQCTDVNGAQQNVSQAFILGFPTLGAGWNLSLGFVGTWLGQPSFTNQGPYVYISPDGGIHKTDINGVTLDDPRLRVKCVTSCTVEFPDGSVGQFTHPIPDPAPTSGASSDFTTGDVGAVMGLTSWTDAFANTLLTVSYGINGAPAWGISSITLHPSSSPANIIFSWTTPVTVTGTDWSGAIITATWPVVNSIQFPTISAGGEYEQAKFTYAATAFMRNTGLDTTETFLCSPPDPKAVLAPTLTQVALNHVTSGGSTINAGNYSIGYDYANHHAALNSITFPAGANIAYTFAGGGPYNPCSTYPVPDLETTDSPAGCTIGPPGGAATPAPQCRLCSITGSSVYVNQRTLTVGSTASTTTYTRNNFVPTFYPTQNLGTGYITRLVEVTESVDFTVPTSPTYRLTRHLFHSPDANSDPTIGGLELGRTVSSGTTFSNSPLRSFINCEQTVSGTGVVSSECGYLTNSGTVNTFSGQGLVRHSGNVTWYGSKPSGTSGGSCSGSTGCDSNVATTSTWVQNAYKYTTSVHSTANLTGNVNRTAKTDWTPCNDSMHWLLDLFDFKSASDAAGPAPLTVQNNYTFESCKPFVTSITTTDSNRTLTTSLTDPGLDGNPDSRTLSGSGTGLSGSFVDNFTWQNGLLLTALRSAVSWKSFDVTRDGATGLITASRDPNGLSTGYTYDGLGRLTQIAPPVGELATSVSYDTPTQTTVSRGSGTTGTFQRFNYDNAGRLAREIREIPQSANSYSTRTHQFDAVGHETFTSEWAACSSTSTCATLSVANGTNVSNFDPFDRPQTITRADSTTTNVSYNDNGILASDLYEAVTINDVGGTAATTITRKDPLGRVYSVVEPAVGGIADTTTYAYNVLDKLACVLQGTGMFVPCTASTGQARAFVYDAQGFLRSETNPEDGGVSGNGTTDYTSYDALGDVLMKTDGGVTYTSQFDPAGRLTTLKADTDATSILNYYDGAGFAGGSYPKGHLTESIGWNMGIFTTPASVVPVTEKFTYGNSTGANGRVTAIETLVGDPAGDLRTDQTLSLAYNSLGLVQTRTHPVVSGTAFTETITYGNGLPTSISTNLGTPVWTSSATYNPAGGLASWRAGSSTGIVTTITPNVIPTRPSSILTSDSGFNTGTYAYDGAGNILNMTKDASNADTFSYDSRSRLTNASYKVAGVTSSQGYSYDRFGNLLAVTGTGARTLAASAATNRLTGVSYDARGNLLAFGGEALAVDKLNRQFDDLNAGIEWGYAYSGSGERVAKVPVSGLVARREMAVEIAQSRGDSAATNCGTPQFSDVPCSDADWGYIQDLFNRGIAFGYAGGTYRPENPVRRDEMAAFMARSITGSDGAVLLTGTVVDGNGSHPYDCSTGGTSYFADVPPDGGAGFCRHINYIASRGITYGNGTYDPITGKPNYAPAQNVPQTQMMAFMQRGWPNYHSVPRGTIYTLRDEANRVINESTDNVFNGPTAANLVTTRDNVFLGNLLVATYVSSTVGGGNAGWTFFHSDHLGTPRYLSNLGNNTGESGTPKYWPYGDEVTPVTTSPKLRFATMERDIENNHYYDHARSHDFNLGRFVSVDKSGGNPGAPQSWNRYSYALNNPIKLKDEKGLDPNCPTCGRQEQSDMVYVKEINRLRAVEGNGLGHPDEDALETAVFVGETAAAIDSGGATTILFAASSGLAAAGNPNDRLGAAMIAGGATLGLAKVPAIGPEGVLGPVVSGFGAAVQQKLTSGAVSFEKTALTIGTSFFTLGLNLGTQAGEVGTAVINSAGKALTFGLSVLGGSTQITKPNPPPPPCKPGTPGCAGLVPGSG